MGDEPSSPGRSRGRGRGRGAERAGGRGQHTARGGPRPNRGRGGGEVASGPPNVDESRPVPVSPRVVPTTAPTAEANEDEVEAEVCFICASPVIHQSVAPCNHRTCHICALRMRALYKNRECAHCRTESKYVIFTDDAVKRFEDYSVGLPDITSTDENIGIRYAQEDIVGDTVLLLRYNCPDGDCDFAGLGWPDLHRHVRSVHQKKMCDLCTRNKKVFTHEHELFTDKELEKHMRHGDDRPGAIDQTGFKGHPICAFCGSRFYDSDKLYEHCRNKHERCFLCDREDPRQPHYYQDYNALEQHFSKDHFLCPDRECQEKKFVVFASEMDLKAHQLTEHGNTLSKDVRRDARLVDISGFDFRQSYQQERRGGGSGRGGRDREGRPPRGRDANAEPLPASSAQPLRRDELAFQRQMAIHSSQSVSNRTFGGQLSSAALAPSSAQPTMPASPQTTQRNAGSGTATPSRIEVEGLNPTDPNLTSEERARLVRHAAVIDRASNMLQNDKAKIDTFRVHISSYRQDKITASALVDSFFSLFSDTASSQLGTLLREVADLFEDSNKADNLRKAWNDWRAINEDYPTLPGLGGMHGATTSSTGWANAVTTTPTVARGDIAPSQRHTTRVLKLKSSTQQSRRGSVQQGTDWAATSTPSSASTNRSAASASSAFPALPSRSRGGSSNTASTPRSQAAASMWGPSSHSAAMSSQPSINSKSYSNPRPIGSSSSGGSSGPGKSEDNFPALPAAPKPLSTIFGYGRGVVRRDLGSNRDTGFSWGGNSAASDELTSPTAEDGEVDGGSKGKKKGNKNKKQVLVQWG